MDDYTDWPSWTCPSCDRHAEHARPGALIRCPCGIVTAQPLGMSRPGKPPPMTDPTDAHCPMCAEHGPYDKATERYEDGCRADAGWHVGSRPDLDAVSQ
jgi:hypothetical protein